MTTPSQRTGNGPLRAALYERVSSEDQVQGYSLDAQDRAGRLYCETQGWEVVRVYRDEGKSARTDDLAKRPQFAAMLGDAESGQLDVIVVHKLDRFSRNRRVAFEAFERLAKAGVGFVSMSEQMDYSSPSGQLMLTMHVGLSQFYSDNLAFETKKGKAERKAQGFYNGIVPFGLKKHADSGLPVPDPETYPGLILAFQLAAQGKSDREVADALNTAGYRTTGNRGRNPFTKDTVCCVLKNRFYLGELPDGCGGWVPGAHQPVLDGDLFAQAVSARRANQSGSLKVTRAHRRHSLSGLGNCAYCGGRLHILTERKGTVRIYCYQRRQISSCPQRSVLLPVIEGQITAYLETFHLPDEIVTEVVSLYESAREQRIDADRQRREIESRLERIAELYAWGDLTREAYLAERDRLQERLTGLRGAAEWTTALTNAAGYLRDLPAAWTAAAPEQRNDLARLIFQSIEVKDDRVIAVIPQPDFAPFFVDRHQRENRGQKNTPDGSGGVNREIEEAEATGIGPSSAFFQLARLSSRIALRFASRADRSGPRTVRPGSGSCQPNRWKRSAQRLATALSASSPPSSA
jgi:DNA invertase Pin-like site-specific DNA recombinase